MKDETETRTSILPHCRSFGTKLSRKKRCGVRLVPPRGSGWVCQSAIGNQETQPLPRGGNDLITPNVNGLKVEGALTFPNSSKSEFPQSLVKRRKVLVENFIASGLQRRPFRVQLL